MRTPSLRPRSIASALTTAMVVLSLFPSASPAQRTIAASNAEQPRPASSTARPAIRWSTVAEINSAPAEQLHYLQGHVQSIKTPDPGSKQPYVIYVTDGTGTARIVVFQETWSRLTNASQFERGVVIQAYGKTNDYKKQRQFVVERPTWIRLSPTVQSTPDSAFRDAAADTKQTGPVLVSMGGIGTKAIGRSVRVRGTVEKVEPSPGERVPTKVTLKDKSGQILVIYWKEVAQELQGVHQPELGAEFEVAGEVQEYQGVMQLRVNESGNVRRAGFPVKPGTGSSGLGGS